MSNSPYVFYLDVLSDWASTIALESQWFLYFDLASVNALKGDLGATVRNYDSGSPASWGISSATTSGLLKDKYQLSTESLVGCVFARQVTLPAEKINASNEGVEYASYLGPATSSNRDPYNKLSIVFTESNASFIDLILRPWSILVGYNGLVARAPGSPKNVKCDFADVVFLAKNGSGNAMSKRKIFRFYNIAPVSVTGLSQTYAAEGMIYGNVDFVYDYYSVFDADTSNHFI
jgi:hypothetical protein